ncbi:N-6 DNA methylase [Glycomyces artemisiae]|uniref:N-6 DNA methylase n=1 Tax=Glycomyces artemisiae TaxID=1076443 RepID=A0A2T0UT65_9ACTN|nr:N-6 DNA methylase [Glycomyces artemisiae]PRY61103.1 N-6 DNA methylase [Glycomyces artemisiae]
MTSRDAGPGETITLTDLARLASVGRNAVSNWRRREPDFPAPVDDSARRPRFSLSALESWALAHGRELQVTGADRLWFRLAAAHPTAEAALEAVAAAFGGDGEPAAEVKALTADAPASDLFEFFIERAREAAGIGVPPGIAPLADIAAAVSGEHTHERIGKTVYDPACDEGDLLAAVAAKIGPCRALDGQDLSGPRAAIAAKRLRLLDGKFRTGGDEGARIGTRTGDSLLSALPEDRYDLVVCDPPFNVKDWGYDRLPDGDDPRLAYGTPPRTEPELAWALHCTALLAPGGHAVVRMPAQVAHRRSGRRIRSELLRWGALRAVVDSPEAKAHIWILTPRGETTQLLVSNGRDFREAWLNFTAAPDAPIATPDSVTVPLMRLWDEDVDVSPAVYLASTPGGADDLADAVARMASRLQAVAGQELPRFTGGAEESAPETSLGDLERDGHLVVAPGTLVPGEEPAGPRCVIVDPVGEPPVRIGLRGEATEIQWTVSCEPTVDLAWIAAALSARLPAASKRTATGAKRRILSVKIPRLTLAEQQRRGAAFARLEALRSALAEAGQQAETLAAEAAAGLVSGAVKVED